ncbi:ricin-type beta-trefoil lectin domain protein [Streptomyces sp. NPDC005301]|uniref:ricin-type beta-trefoil lectin domain protein n=1 Tax=unclassified Streptomyces TaxID=2593676 RepID=UPI0033BC8AE0
MNDLAPPNSSAPGRAPEPTDEQLAVELKKHSGKGPANRPVEELLARHWESAFSYALLCADGPHPAGMLTTAAFTRLFEEALRGSGPTAAWRPEVLVAVRRIAAEWDTDHRRQLLHPALLSAAEDGERAASRLLPTATGRLVSRAFQRLGAPARCLLWHAEVEAEPLEAPAALLGLSTEDAAVKLERARSLLRAGCLDVHRELAPDQECRRYSRLLDVSLRRDDDILDPDLRDHLATCRHCGQAAGQLDHRDGRLALLLAEAVLGWGARDYLDSRPGQADEGPGEERTAWPGGVPGGEPSTGTAAPAGPVTGTASRGGAGSPAAPARPPRAGSRTATLRAHRRARHRRHLALAALTAGVCVLVPLIVWAASGDGDGRPAGGNGPHKESAPGSPPSWVSAADRGPVGTLRGRLRNTASGLCVGLDRGRPVAGAEAVLVPCGAAADQQWVYETDGLLRSGSAPDLCLDSHLGDSVVLGGCTDAAGPGTGNVRYDFTPRGSLVPRWNRDLALTPASSRDGAALVLKPRADESAEQRWVTDTSADRLRPESVDWDSADRPASPRDASPKPSAPPSPTATRTPAPTEAPSGGPGQDTCSWSTCGDDGHGWWGRGGRGHRH